MKRQGKTLQQSFDLTGRVAVITGGAGFLAAAHAQVIAQAGGIPVLADLQRVQAERRAREISAQYGTQALGLQVDITKPPQVKRMRDILLSRWGRVDILINNAAHNPKMEEGSRALWSRVESFPLKTWNADIAVGLTGAFLCSQILGASMARRKRGVILNIASDLALIAPDQRIYRLPGNPKQKQPVKPVSYSVVKTALVGLTRYLATYWAREGIRVNALCLGGVSNDQPSGFARRLSRLIPLGRMARRDEAKAAVLFLCSDASSYMTGASLVVDGGRSCW